MPMYYVEGNTHCCLRIADNATQAERSMREDLGSYGGPYRATLATKDHVADVSAMGGYVPSGHKLST